MTQQKKIINAAVDEFSPYRLEGSLKCFERFASLLWEQDPEPFGTVVKYRNSFDFSPWPGVPYLNNAPQTRSAEPVTLKREPLCRDCADFGPICPLDGNPCDPDAPPPAHSADMSLMQSSAFEVCDTLVKILVGEDLTPIWWNTSNTAFDLRTPKEVFECDPQRVQDYLEFYADRA